MPCGDTHRTQTNDDSIFLLVPTGLATDEAVEDRNSPETPGRGGEIFRVVSLVSV